MQSPVKGSPVSLITLAVIATLMILGWVAAV